MSFTQISLFFVLFLVSFFSGSLIGTWLFYWWVHHFTTRQGTRVEHWFVACPPKNNLTERHNSQPRHSQNTTNLPVFNEKRINRTHRAPPLCTRRSKRQQKHAGHAATGGPRHQRARTPVFPRMYTTPAYSSNQSVRTHGSHHTYESIDGKMVLNYHYENGSVINPGRYENSAFRPDSTSGEYEFTPGGYEELNRVQYQNTRNFLERFYERLQTTN